MDTTRDMGVRLPGLRAARRRRFLTQEELAERAGLTRWTITDLEKGERQARFDNLRALAAALDVAPEELTTPPKED